MYILNLILQSAEDVLGIVNALFRPAIKLSFYFYETIYKATLYVPFLV